MQELTKSEAIEYLYDAPVVLGHLLGFDKLEELHNEWIQLMIDNTPEDKTLQAHRGSYKTTCVSLALAIIIIAFPNDRTLFMRKTNTDVEEIVAQVKKILQSKFVAAIVGAIYKVKLKLTVDNATEISTNLVENDIKGTSQLVAIGMGSSITGKHFDRIFTDDIVNVEDRTSKAERRKTKIAYQELQNIKNRGGRIFNTGTPWHKDDCFTIMPEAMKYDCYSTGLISKEELQALKNRMTASLFAANYELRHIAEEDVIFSNPQTDAEPALAEQGTCHIDAAYGGADYTAFTIVKKREGKYYVFGKLWQKHVDECLTDIVKYRKAFNAGRISCENNGDKGYLGKSLRKLKERTHVYHENMNKYLKITSYLKHEWTNVIFVAGTDQEYINQICDYNENAEHDDAPDSLASLIRESWKKSTKDESKEDLMYL